MSQVDRAIRLNDTMSSPGWKDVEEMLSEQVSDIRETLIGIMALKPDELTGKKAIRLASRQKALTDFLESLKDEVRINLPSNQPQPGRAGTK